MLGGDLFVDSGYRVQDQAFGLDAVYRVQSLFIAQV